jgi:hypothetical protein
VTVKVPSSDEFVALSEKTDLPPGTEVDVTEGAMLLQPRTECPGMALFGDGDGVSSRFVLTGQKSCGAIVRLIGGDFSLCKKASTSASRSLSVAGKTRAKPVRRLWGKGVGNYRTRGRYSSGTVRGTFWLTADFCDGTLTHVRTGVVDVLDFVTKRTKRLRAGQTYFARPARKK